MFGAPCTLVYAVSIGVQFIDSSIQGSNKQVVLFRIFILTTATIHHLSLSSLILQYISMYGFLNRHTFSNNQGYNSTDIDLQSSNIS